MLAAVVEGLVVLCLVSGIQGGKRFQDVMEFRRDPGSRGHSNHIDGWSPDTNSWDEKLYPAWKSDDARWENCWRGGKVKALLTSDSPALIGSNITFAVTLQLPRCQKENEDGDIVYEGGCGNVSSFPDQYVYNWTKWINFCNKGNCSFANKFPDGKPFPHHPHWRRNNFIYIFSTQGQYYAKNGRSSAVLSINTTNITTGTQMIEVTVYRKGHWKHYPVAKASSIYVITDQIPFYVKLSQKNDKNSSDHLFIKDSPINFDIRIHDPSNYLNKSKLTFDWDYGDGNGSFSSNNPLSNHTYDMFGNYTAMLTIKAAIPGPCNPVTPTTPVPTTHLPTTTSTITTTNSTGNSTELPPFETETFPLTTEMPNVTTAHITTAHTTAAPGCFIYRYGYYSTNITVVDGILEVKIVEMTNVEVSTSQTGNSIIDFVVTCQGSLPTDACTIVSDASCMIPQDIVCDSVPSSDQCLLTLRRTFQPGSYCVNITLSDSASLGLASTLVSVNGGSKLQALSAVLLSLALVGVVAVVIGIALYKKRKEYKPIANASDESGQGITVYFSQIKDVLFQRNNEHNPLLKKASII
ncbi:protein QNR-71-like [Hyla sarda]|uniref:protein QNR-71-like n=1 Tax=Hyla sarda TaxID=327740 RepID=UPI0024C3458E|nr:protein QNR-71-like [Hyla sarda]